MNIGQPASALTEQSQMNTLCLRSEWRSRRPHRRRDENHYPRRRQGITAGKSSLKNSSSDANVCSSDSATLA